MKKLNTQNAELFSDFTSTNTSEGNTQLGKCFDAIYAFSIAQDKNDVYRPDFRIKSGYYVPIDELLSSPSTYIVVKPVLGSSRVRFKLIDNDRVTAATFMIGCNYGFGRIWDELGARTFEKDCLIVFHHLVSSTYFVVIAKGRASQRYVLMDRMRNGDFESEFCDFLNLIKDLGLIRAVETINEELVVEA